MTVLQVCLFAVYLIIESVHTLPTNTTISELVAKDGYPLETHYLTTRDGYILGIHRIPHGRSGVSNDSRVAFLQHGILSSSASWVCVGQELSLAYQLADEGYDVWLGNARGNTYSRNHTTMDPDNNKTFWDFSWHEIGTIDIPESIDYVLNCTEADGVYYFGHSQGTTVLFVMLSMRPEYNSKIKVAFCLSPVVYVQFMFSPILRMLALGGLPASLVLENTGQDEFLPSDGILSQLRKDMCSTDGGALMCVNSFFAICGFDPDQMNTTITQLMVRVHPAGSSTKQFLHHAQEINSGRFCQYDYGPTENARRYNGSFIPPNYDLSEVSAAVVLIYSWNDWLSSILDVNRLIGQLSNVKEKYYISKPPFNHMDFLYGKDARRIVFDKIVGMCGKY